MAAPMESGAGEFCPCDDIIRFTKALNKLRQSDDRFIYKLNTILPTQSFQSKTDPTKECETVYHQMMVNYERREKSIQRCLEMKKAEVKTLRERQAANRDDPDIRLQLNNAALMLKQFQKEAPQELILRNKSFKLFYERCSDYYTPPS